MEHGTSAKAIRRWFAAGLAAVAPEAAVQHSLTRSDHGLMVDGDSVPVAGRLVVVGVGKAAVAMARGVEAVCGDVIAAGLVITKDGHAREGGLDRIRVAEGAHPIPDHRCVVATREILDLVGQTGAADVVLALISGGGSALLEAPIPPVTLDDMAVTTDLLLRAGAPIEALNAVRIPLSRVKGGGLRRAAPRARFITLILSDVLSNDPKVIASGPTIVSDPAPDRALAIIDRYQLTGRVPESVLSVLRLGVERQGDMARADKRDVVAIVGDNGTAVAAVAAAAQRDGFRADVIWTKREGEARDLGQKWIDACAAADPAVNALLGGGEATVTVRGDGIGGRNTEFALAAALAMEERQLTGWTIASLATDGQDGPANVAGAIADAGTARRARNAGVDPVVALAANDSLRVFQAAGGVVDTGPTGTNVNDLYLAVRQPAG